MELERAALGAAGGGKNRGAVAVGGGRGCSLGAHAEAGKIVVIPNAVDLSRTVAVRLEHAGKRVGFIGRLDPVKRVPDLVRAVGYLGGNVSLDIYGEGSQRAEIERTVRQLGLESRVKLHGAISGPEGALAEMDVLVLPSEAEGFGLVLIEAMAAGVPVVGTDVAGIRDVVVDGENGLLAPVGNPRALCSGFNKCWLTRGCVKDWLRPLKGRLRTNSTGTRYSSCTAHC